MQMIRQGGLALSKHDLKVFKVIEEYRQGLFDLDQAAAKLGVSVRTVQRRLKAIRAHGISGLVHGNRGRCPANKKSSATRDWYVTLFKGTYYDFNLTHAFEMICERHVLPEKVCFDTFRNWIRAEGLGKTQKRRPSRARLLRERHANEGLMIQFDGSPHRYNGKDKWTLIHAVDDATSKLLWAEFFPSETTLGCMKVIRSVIETYGVPEFILTDCAGWSARIGKRAYFSQFERACNELGITVIPTPSAPSKGRVERSFRTAQGRLPPELRLEGIKTMDTANRYLRQIFKPRWNERFAVEPRATSTRFKPIPAHKNLDEVFCFKETRQVMKDHTVHFEGDRYKLLEPPMNLWKHEVVISKYESGEIRIDYGPTRLKIEKIVLPTRRWKMGA